MKIFRWVPTAFGTTITTIRQLSESIDRQMSEFLATIYNELSTISSDLDTLESTVSTATSDLDTLESTVSTIGSDLDTLESTVSGLSPGYAQFMFYYDNLPANSATIRFLALGVNTYDYPVGYAGNIVGFAIRLSANCTGGTLTVYAKKNSSRQSSEYITIDSTNNNNQYINLSTPIALSAGDYVGIDATSDASFTPNISLDATVTLYIQYS